MTSPLRGLQNVRFRNWSGRFRSTWSHGAACARAQVLVLQRLRTRYTFCPSRGSYKPRRRGFARNRIAPGGPSMASVGQDLRYAVRRMRKTSGFTAAAIVTLALGLGVNSAVMSIAEGI